MMKVLNAVSHMSVRDSSFSKLFVYLGVLFVEKEVYLGDGCRPYKKGNRQSLILRRYANL
jgi:hypothetical protein